MGNATPSGHDLQLDDGRTLYAERSGGGPSTVVFEAGMGSSRSAWGAVAPAVAERATAVVYDRSGLGRSPHDPEPRTLARLTDDLIQVLEQMGGGPAVLVGHSWGGPIIRGVTAGRPDLVGGLVLVDPTDEGFDHFFTDAHRRQTAMTVPLLPLMARLGLVRMGVKRLARHLPPAAAAAMVAEDGTAASTRTMIAELDPWIEDLRRLRAEPLAVPDVPVTVISGIQPSRSERGQRSALVDCHRARAGAHPQGRHVEANDSGHHVHLTEPQLVVDEIFRILDVLETPETLS